MIKMNVEIDERFENHVLILFGLHPFTLLSLLLLLGHCYK